MEPIRLKPEGHVRFFYSKERLRPAALDRKRLGVSSAWGWGPTRKKR